MTPAHTDEEKEALLDTMLNAWTNQDVETMQACFVPDCVYEDMAMQLRIEGHEGLKMFLEGGHAEMGDMKAIYNFRFVKGNRGAAEWVITAVAKGKFEGVDRSGHKIEFSGLSAYTFRDGLIETAKDCWDYAAMMRDLGVVSKELAQLEHA